MTTTKTIAFSKVLSRPLAWMVLGLLSAVMGPLGQAQAAVTEPHGLMVPQPPKAEEISVAGQNPLAPLITLDALFKNRQETLDWQKDAKTKPDTFSPVCGFNAELVLRGGNCNIDFGWYNVVAGHVPTDAEIYPVITAAQIAALPAFSPGVGQRGPRFDGASILRNTNYKGGQIGFATKGKTGTVCTQTHFSQRDNNLLCTAAICGKGGDNNDHWIMAVIYKSTVDTNGYYIGFEDLPNAVDSFTTTGQYQNDGDMNDFVFYITGITCPGGGKRCSTGMPGVCAEGVNECQTGGALTCKPAITASAEKCDGLDNDCDGMTDEGDDICPGTFKCVRGQCLGACGTTEFPCSAAQVCDEASGFCVDPACLGVTCDLGKVCVGGTCKGSCDGVVCPANQQCRVGRCVDPCDGVTCAADRACREGVCVARCDCLACDDDLACQTSTGKCVEKGCEGKTCTAAQVCKAGNCVDACAGAMCPGGGECKAGKCIDNGMPAGGTGGKPGATGGISGGTGGATGGTTATGGAATGGAAMATGGMVGNGTGGESKAELTGCHCSLDDGRFGTASGLLVVAAAFIVGRRRRSR